MNEPRVYRQSPYQFIFLLIVAVVLGIVFLPLALQGEWVITLLVALMAGLFIIIAVSSMSSAILVSNQEISSQRFWVTRSLAWNEIQQVSGSGNGVKLKNFDGDVTVSLNSQIPGYEEVIDVIGEKRPDLFASPEFTVMERGVLITVMPIVTGLIFVGLGTWIALQNNSTWFTGIFFGVIGVSAAFLFLGAPQKLELDGSSLIVKYLLKENTFQANDIEDVRLIHQRTRNGRVYFVQLVLKNNKKLNISNLKPGTAMVYLVLREWHKRQTAAKLSV